MSETNYKTYVCSYTFHGSKWSFDIYARDLAEARLRVAAIGWDGNVDGEVYARIPAAVGFWVPVWVWLRNLFALPTQRGE